MSVVFPFKMIVPSHKREHVIMQKTLRLFPFATVTVAESEVDNYVKAGVPKKQILPHPDDVKPVGPIYRWVLENVDDEIIWGVDDDIDYADSLVGWRTRRYTTTEECAQILINCTECAIGFGTHYCGFRNNASPVWYRPYDPMTMHHFVGGVMGFIGRVPEIKHDPQIYTNEDIDYSLQVMLHPQSRMVFMDARYYFGTAGMHGFGGTNEGGMQNIRTADNILKSMYRLKDKWGCYIELAEKNKTPTVKMKAKRRQIDSSGD